MLQYIYTEESPPLIKRIKKRWKPNSGSLHWGSVPELMILRNFICICIYDELCTKIYIQKFSLQSLVSMQGKFLRIKENTMIFASIANILFML